MRKYNSSVDVDGEAEEEDVAVAVLINSVLSGVEPVQVKQLAADHSIAQKIRKWVLLGKLQILLLLSAEFQNPGANHETALAGEMVVETCDHEERDEYAVIEKQ